MLLSQVLGLSGLKDAVDTLNTNLTDTDPAEIVQPPVNGFNASAPVSVAVSGAVISANPNRIGAYLTVRSGGQAVEYGNPGVVWGGGFRVQPGTPPLWVPTQGAVHAVVSSGSGTIDVLDLVKS